MVDIPDLDRGGLRRFGLTFGGIVAVLFGLLLPFVLGFEYPLWPWVVLAVFAAWSLVAPSSLHTFYRLWMRFGLLLNAVTSRVILGVVFYLVVFPIGIFVKLKHRDPMNRRLDSQLTTYRTASEKKDAARMEKPF